MALIVLQHYSGGANWVWERESPTYLWANEFLVKCMATSGKIGVDIFLLMTGYFLNGKPLRSSSLARTWFQTVNWSYMILLIAYFTSEVTPYQMKLSLMPVIYHGYWFVSSYMVMAFCTGWIASLVNFTTPAQYFSGLVALIFVMGFSTWSLEIAFCNALWFFMTVSLGATLRKYITTLRNIRTRWLVVVLLLACAVNYGSVYLFTFHEINFAIAKKGSNALTSNNWSVLCLIYGIVLIILTERLAVTSAYINKMASCTLGVYLIHESMFVAPRIFTQYANGAIYKDSPFLLIIILFEFCSVYVACSALECLRKLTLGVVEEKVSKFVGTHMDSLATRLNHAWEDEKAEV